MAFPPFGPSGKSGKLGAMQRAAQRAPAGVPEDQARQLTHEPTVMQPGTSAPDPSTAGDPDMDDAPGQGQHDDVSIITNAALTDPVIAAIAHVLGIG